MRKFGEGSSSISRNIAMCRKIIRSGRETRDGVTYSRASVAIHKPSHPTSMPSAHSCGWTGGPRGVIAR
jgi:hypothetical protein